MLSSQTQFPSLFQPIAPGCPNCEQLMGIKNAESWTLLRGHQLDRYTFECDDCGHVAVRMVEEDRL